MPYDSERRGVGHIDPIEPYVGPSPSRFAKREESPDRSKEFEGKLKVRRRKAQQERGRARRTKRQKATLGRALAPPAERNADYELTWTTEEFKRFLAAMK